MGIVDQDTRSLDYRSCKVSGLRTVRGLWALG